MANTVDGVETAVEPFDAFEDLLAALARGPDIRDIFRHLSAVFSRIVPHEEAHLAVLTGDDDRILLYTATRDCTVAADRVSARHSHGLFARVGDCKQDVAARPAGHCVHRSGGESHSSGGLDRRRSESHPGQADHGTA